MNKAKFGLIVGIVSILGTANAASIQSDINVSSNVEKGCFVKADNIEMGDYNPYERLDKNQGFNLLCSKETAYTVKIPFSENSVGSQRYMKINGGEEKLAYNLYRAALRTAVWGDGVSGGTVGGGVGDGTLKSLPLFPRIDMMQFVKAGNYSDTVTIVLEY